MTLGILGGGQLGRMTAFAALRLGLDVRFLVPAPADSVACFAHVTVADWTDPDVLRAFAAACDAVTVESEWAPADLLADAAPEHARLAGARDAPDRARQGPAARQRSPPPGSRSPLSACAQPSTPSAPRSTRSACPSW